MIVQEHIPIARDERQARCITNWKKLNGHGTIVAATGFGKTRVAIKTIKFLQEITPTISIIVVVPTTALQEQWMDNLRAQNCLMDHVQVYVINSVIKQSHSCNLLILDEAHRYPADSFSQVFQRVRYDMIQCLTATLERLDGKHTLITKHAPVVDTITIEECLLNKWVSNYKEYAVIIEPDDLEIYEEMTRYFNEHFEFFDYDFNLVMSMTGKDGWRRRDSYAREICHNATALEEIRKAVTIHSVECFRAMQKRKKYIAEHPEKLRVAEEIIAHRPNEKIVTFSGSIAAAERFSDGYIYTGRDSKKANRLTLDEFSKMKSGILHTVKLGDEGLDVPDLSVGIMMGINSSKIKHIQTRGRIVRYQEGKEAEFFTLLLKDTVEIDWWRRAVGNYNKVELLDEENLMKVLRHEPYETYKEPLKQFASRF